MTTNRIDILIVGAGPTGLMMASELTRHGVPCRIIDKSPHPSAQSKALAIQTRTLEIFDHTGLIDPFLDEGLRLVAGNMISKGEILAHIDFKQIPSPYPFVLSLPQNRTEALLIEHLARRGVHVERQVELLSVTQTKQEASAELFDHRTGSKEQLSADWVIGCDGAHSIIRKIIGASFEGKLFPDVFSLADIDIHWDLPDDQVCAFVEPEGVMAAFPLPGENRYRLIFQMERCRNALHEGVSHREGLVDNKVIADPTMEETRALLCKYTHKDIHIENPRWLANFHINSRLSSTYRKGRLFLVGDASHIHSPVGGQGMNTGIQDAFNLSWKLALVTKRKGNTAILDTYQQERHSIGKKLLQATEKASFAVTLHNPILVGIRNFFISHLSKLKFLQRRITISLSQLWIGYAHSALNVDKGRFQGHLKIGDRAPNCVVSHLEKTTDLFALWKGTTSGTVLLLTGTEEGVFEELECLAGELKQKYDVQVMIISIDEHVSSEHIVAIDPNMDVHTLYGVREKTAYFIRPDLYISYREQPAQSESIQSYLATITLPASKKDTRTLTHV